MNNNKSKNNNLKNNTQDTYSDSHIVDTATTAGAAADKAASNKEAKYRQLANSHIFVPVAIETAGTWNNRAVELVQELSRRITAVTEDTREATYLFQRLSNGEMWSPSIALSPPNKCHCSLTCLVFNTSPSRIEY